MKRLIAFVLAVAMSFSIVMPSVAAAYESSASGSGSISAQESASVSEQESASVSEQESAEAESASSEAEAEGQESASAGSSSEEESASSEEEKSSEPAPKADKSGTSSQGDQSARPDGSGSDVSPETSGSGDQSAEASADKSTPETSPDNSLPEESSARADLSEALSPNQKTLKKTLQCVDGVRYTITLTYDESAELPDGTKLSLVEVNRTLTAEEQQRKENKKRPYSTERFVSEKALEQDTFDLREGLQIQARDYVLFTKFLDLNLTHNGKTVQPKAPVIVTVETDAVQEGASDALELAYYDKAATKEWKKELKRLRKEREARIKAGKVVEVEQRMKTRVFTALEAVNQTQKGKGVKLSFQTQEFTRLGVAAVASELESWREQDETVSVYGPRHLKAKVRKESMKKPEEGLEQVQAFSVVVDERPENTPDYDVTFWVGANQARSRAEDTDLVVQSDEEEPESGLTARKLKNGKAGAELIGPQSSDAPVSIRQGDGVALLWDTGLRKQSVEAENVSVEGLLPKNAQLTANDMLWRYSRPEEIVKTVSEDAETLAAYDITISGRQGEFQPGDGKSVSVTIQNEGISSKQNLEVWHLSDNGEVEVLTDLTVKDGAVSFDATGFSVYMVVEITKEQVLTASDGNQYKVTVTYDSDAGIPEDAELQVSEFASDSKDYKKYVKKAAKKLDAEVNDLTFAHAFDIALVNPESGEHYQPAKPLKVSVKLLGEDVDENSPIDVVHFGDETQVMESSVNGESIEFETDGFSVYVVISHENDLTTVETPRVEFHFISDDFSGDSPYTAPAYEFVNKADQTQTSQIIRNNEGLEQIKNPRNKENPDRYFYGWYVVNYTDVADNGTITYTWPVDPQKIGYEEPIEVSGELSGDKYYVTWKLNGVTNRVEADETGCAHVYLAPIYRNYYFVNFHMGELDGGTAYKALENTIFVRRLVVFGVNDTVDVRIGDIPATPVKPKTQIFSGWKEKVDGGPNKDHITVNRDGVEQNSTDPAHTDGYYITVQKKANAETIVSVDLYPIFTPAQWIHFNTGESGNGATYVGADYLIVRDNNTFDDYKTKLPTSRRTGYRFQGWYTEANGGGTQITDADGNVVHQANGTTSTYQTTTDGRLYLYSGLGDNGLTLYAKWQKEANTTYQVVVWKQKVSDTVGSSDKHYDFVSAYTSDSISSDTIITDNSTGGVGTTLCKFKGTDMNGLPVGGNNGINLLGFNYTGFKMPTTDVANTTLKPDGTTVYNVYYDRQDYTLTFQIYDYTYTQATNNNGTQYGIYNGEYVQLFYYDETWYRTKTTIGWGWNQRTKYSNPYYGTRYTRSNFQSWQTIYTIHELYQKNISSHFPIHGTNGVTYDNGERWDPVWDSINDTTPNNTKNDVLVYLDIMPNKDIIFQLNIADRPLKIINYYVEALNRSTETETAPATVTAPATLYDYNNNAVSSGNRTFEKYNTVKARYNGVTKDEDFINLIGFDRLGADSKYDNSGFYIYSTTQDGTINFYYTRHTANLTFNANYPVVTGLTFKVNGTDVEWNFKYGDENGCNIQGLNNKYVTVPLMYDQSTSDYSYDTKTNSGYYGPNGTVPLMVPNNYVFKGWYEDPVWLYDEERDHDEALDVDKSFDFNSKMPDGGKVLYAKWEPIKIRIHVDPDGGVIDHVNYGETDEHGQALASNASLPAVTSGFRDAYKGSGYLGHNTDGATYFNCYYHGQVDEYEEDVEFQAPNYVPISHSEALARAGASPSQPVYYYFNNQFERTNTKQDADLRNAMYLTDAQIERYVAYFNAVNRSDLSVGGWKSIYLEKNEAEDCYQEYRPCNTEEHYRFLGWYKYNPTTGEYDTPYAFAPDVEGDKADGSGDLYLKAKWRLEGQYAIFYTAYYYVESDQRWINGEMDVWQDPNQSLSERYSDTARTTVFKQPTALKYADGTDASEDYIFRGWRLVSRSQVGTDANNKPVYDYTPLEGENKFYDPGDPFTIRARYADENSFIHMQAVYEPRTSAYRRPQVVSLSLDANMDKGGYLKKSTAADAERMTENTSLDDLWDYAGTVGAVVNDNGTDNAARIDFGDTQPNVSVQLSKFKDYFRNSKGYRLLGFDDRADEGDYIAKYHADSVISRSRIASAGEATPTVYAVWEPLVYIDLVNKTGVNSVKLSLSGGSTQSLIIVNKATGEFERTVQDKSNIVVPMGTEDSPTTLRLAVPRALLDDSGEDTLNSAHFTFSGTNRLGPGNILIWNTSDVDGATVSGQKNNTEEFSFSGDLVRNSDLYGESVLTVTFTSKKNDFTLLFKDNYPGGSEQAQEKNFSWDEVLTDKADLAHPVPKTFTTYNTNTRFSYTLLGWSEDEHWADTHNVNTEYPEYSGNPALPSERRWKILDLETFFEATTTPQTIKYLYAVWKPDTEAKVVRIYKNVPEAHGGNREQEFTFTVALSGTFKKTNGGETDNLSASDTFTLKHNEYLKITSSAIVDNGSSPAYLQSVVQRFRVGAGPNNTDSEVGNPKTITAKCSFNGAGSFEGSERFTVTETAHSCYDTTAALSVLHDDSYPLYYNNDTTLGSSSAATNSVYWKSAEAGGSVVFTNTRKTTNVTVEKQLVNTTTGTYLFNASYTLEDSVVHNLPDFTITGADSHTISNIPMGANVSISEPSNVDYTVTATGTTGTYDATAQTFTMMADRAPNVSKVTFKNTLKTVPVTFISQTEGGGYVEGIFSLQSSATGGYEFRNAPVDSSTCQFYSNDLPMGTYTLTQTFVAEGYLALNEKRPVTITFSGNGTCSYSPENVELQVTGSMASGYTVTVINRATKKITIQKQLEDELLLGNGRRFQFTASYSLTDVNDRQITSTVTLPQMPLVKNGETKEIFFYAPAGSNVTVAEDVSEIASQYDTTLSYNGGSETAGSSYTIENLSADATVKFINRQKRVSLTVKKVVHPSAAQDSYTFTATLLNSNGDPIQSTPARTDAQGQVSFSLSNGGTRVLSVPSGATVVLEETTTGTTVSASSAAGLSNTDTSGNSRIFKLARLTQDDTVTFTNTYGLNLVTYSVINDGESVPAPVAGSEGVWPFEDVSGEITLNQGFADTWKSHKGYTLEDKYTFRYASLYESDTLVSGAAQVSALNFNSTTKKWQYKPEGGSFTDVPDGAVLRLHCQYDPVRLWFDFNGGTNDNAEIHDGIPVESAFQSDGAQSFNTYDAAHDVHKDLSVLVGWSTDIRSDLAEDAALPTDAQFIPVGAQVSVNRASGTYTVTVGSETRTLADVYDSTTALHAVWRISSWVCKITDATDNETLLYYKVGGTNSNPTCAEAVFTQLEGNSGAIRKLGSLYKKNGNSYVKYTGPTKIQMLVSSYTLTAEASFGAFTTELTTARETPLDSADTHNGPGSTAVIVAKSTMTARMFNLSNTDSDVTVSNLTIDGNSRNGRVCGTYGGIFNLELNQKAKLTLANGATLQYSKAASQGAAIDNHNGTLTMLEGSKITECSAPHGSAIYMGGHDENNVSVLNMSGGTITGNIVTGVDGGAIEVVYPTDPNHQDKIYNFLNFSGNPTVFDNHNSSNQQANVYLPYNNTGVINAVGSGLSAGAKIGVWPAPDPNRDEGEPFGATVAAASNGLLMGFVNDYHMDHTSVQKYLIGWPKTPGSADQIIWKNVICETTDANNNLLYYKSGNLYYPAVYGTLQTNGAFQDIDNGNLYSFDGTSYTAYTGEYKVQMLTDYTMPDNDRVTVPTGKTVTLTTATTGTYQYPGTDANRKATITRGADGGSLIINSGTLTLDQIVLDGNKTTCTATSDGGLVKVNTDASLTVNDDAVLQNSKVQYQDGNIKGNGGAIFASGTVNVTGGTISGNTAEKGAAIYGDSTSVLNISGGSITGNTASNTSSGAVEGGVINFSGNPNVYDNKNGSNQRNVVLNADSDTVINVTGALSDDDTKKIGVYATQGNRWLSGMDFGSYEGSLTGHLNRFKNDRDETLYGMVDSDNAQKICWVYGTITITKAWKNNDHPDSVTVQLRRGEWKTDMHADTTWGQPFSYIDWSSDALTPIGQTTADIVLDGNNNWSKAVRVPIDSKILSFPAAKNKYSAYSQSYGSNYYVTETKVGDAQYVNSEYTATYSQRQLTNLTPENAHNLSVTITNRKKQYLAPVVVHKDWSENTPDSYKKPVTLNLYGKLSDSYTEVKNGVNVDSTPGCYIGNSTTPEQWSTLQYLKTKGDGGTYTEYKAEEPNLLTKDNGIWSAESTYTAPEQWVKVTDNTQMTDAYLRLRYTGTVNNGNDNNLNHINKMVFYFKTQDNIWYESTVTPSSTVSLTGGMGAVHYVKLSVPADVSLEDLTLQSSGYITLGGLSYCYGLKLGAAAPSFSQGTSRANANQFDQVEFMPNANLVEAAESTAFTGTQTLRVLAAKRVVLTNTCDAIARVRNKPTGGSWSDWTYFAYLTTTTVDGNSITGAFNYANGLTGEVEIETLLENHERYTLTDGFTFNKSGITKLTLQTTQEAPWNSGTTKFRSTIQRGSSNTNSLMTSSVTEFNLTNIILDGGGIKATDGTWSGFSCNSGKGGLVNVTGGALNVLGGTTMQNTKATNEGGAIYAGASAGLSVNGTKTGTGTTAKYSVNFTNCEGKFGGAIFHERGALTTSVTGSSFDNCETTSTGNKYGGGAVCTRQKKSEFTDCSFNKCSTLLVTGEQPQGGAILHSGLSGNPIESDDSSTSTDHSSTTIESCIFKDCSSGGAGGAVDAETVEVSVKNSTFTDCESGLGQQKDGGALEASPKDNYNGTHVGSELTVENCIFESSQATRAGGAIRSLMEKNILTDNTFCECETTTTANKKAHGGAVIFLNNTDGAYATVSGCEFLNCEAKGTDMNGGAIYSAVKKLTVQSSENVTGSSKKRASRFINCASNGNGGAIYSKAGSGTNQGTILSDCVFDGHETYVPEHPHEDPEEPLVLADANKNAVNGGAIYIESGPLSITDSVLTDCVASNNGGAVCIKNASINVTLKNVTIDGHDTLAVKYLNANKGGAIFMDDAGNSHPTLYLTDTNQPNTIRNCSATNGGAVYLNKANQANGANMELTDGSTITGNSATEAGAGIYVADGAVLKLSGAPNFGGTDLYTEADKTAGNIPSGKSVGDIKGTDGNFLTTTLGTTVNGQTSYPNNGTKPYTKARQDIYIIEAHENAPASILITGDLTKADGTYIGDGTIWVWAESAYHHKQFMPFAKPNTGVVFAETPTGTQLDSAHLKAFRNARDDDTTENGTDSWLYGWLEGEPAGYIFWFGSSGSGKVILRKVDSSYAPVSNKTFDIFRGTSTTAYTPKGETTSLSGLLSGQSGCFFIGTLPYGWYIVKENTTPAKYFYVVVTASGNYGTLNEDGTDKADGYPTLTEAQSKALEVYNAKK